MSQLCPFKLLELAVVVNVSRTCVIRVQVEHERAASLDTVVGDVADILAPA